MRTEVGIGGDLMNAFTMGATLNAVSGSSGFINTVIKGATLDIASYSRQKYMIWIAFMRASWQQRYNMTLNVFLLQLTGLSRKIPGLRIIHF